MNPLPERRPPSRRRTLLLLLKIVFSVSVLALIIIYKAPVRDILAVLRTVGLGWLVAAFSLHAVGIFVSAYRWQILARAQGDEIPLGYLMKSYLVGTFFNNFLPSSFGGDIVRIWDGSRFSQSLVKSSAIVVVERATGIIVLFLFALFASLFRLDMANEVPVIWAALVLGLAGLALAALFFTPLAERTLRRCRAGSSSGPPRRSSSPSGRSSWTIGTTRARSSGPPSGPWSSRPTSSSTSSSSARPSASISGSRTTSSSFPSSSSSRPSR